MLNQLFLLVIGCISCGLQILIFKVTKKKVSLVFIPIISILGILALIAWVIYMGDAHTLIIALLFMYLIGAIIMGSTVGGLIALKKVTEDRNPPNSENHQNS